MTKKSQKKQHYPDNIGINDCVHAKACRRLRKRIEKEHGIYVTLGCFKDTCSAYEQKTDARAYTREQLETAFARATDPSLDWGGSTIDDYLQGL